MNMIIYYSTSSIPRAFSSYNTNLEDFIKEATKNDEEYLKVRKQLETDSNGMIQFIL